MTNVQRLMANDYLFAVEKKEKRRKSKEARAKTPFWSYFKCWII